MGYRVDKTLYLTKDKRHLIPESPGSGYLFKRQGGEVSKAEINTWGKELTQHIPEGTKKKPVEKPEEKKTEPKENKKIIPEENKRSKK